MAGNAQRKMFPFDDVIMSRKVNKVFTSIREIYVFWGPSSATLINVWVYTQRRGEIEIDTFNKDEEIMQNLLALHRAHFSFAGIFLFSLWYFPGILRSVMISQYLYLAIYQSVHVYQETQ